jgi:hypothetical protein
MSDKQGVLYETRTSQEWLEEVDKWPWQKVNKDTWQKLGSTLAIWPRSKPHYFRFLGCP